MKEYHLRRNEKLLKNEKIISKILKEHPYLTIALCNDNMPYLVTLNYAYDQENESFYIHCANSPISVLDYYLYRFLNHLYFPGRLKTAPDHQ